MRTKKEHNSMDIKDQVSRIIRDEEKIVERQKEYFKQRTEEIINTTDEHTEVKKQASSDNITVKMINFMREKKYKQLRNLRIRISG